MKTFEVQFRYRDRNEAEVESTVKLDASSLPGAVAKAAREFVKGLDRKQRFDMNKNGLEITAKSLGATTEAQAKTSAGAIDSTSTFMERAAAIPTRNLN